jgi:hypothetical protein
MTLATSITQTDVTALEKALSRGILEVTTDSGGVRRTTKYNTIADLIKALDYARSRLQEQSDAISGAAGSTTFATFSRM